MDKIRSLKDFSDLVRRERRARGWTQAELGQRAGLATKHVSRLENGANEPRVSTMLAVLAALGTELSATPLGQAAPGEIGDIF